MLRGKGGGSSVIFHESGCETMETIDLADVLVSWSVGQLLEAFKFWGGFDCPGCVTGRSDQGPLTIYPLEVRRFWLCRK